MRFALTEEQTDLVATVHTLIAKRAASMDLRAAIATPEGYDTTLWQTMTEQIGVTALAVPEAYGGVGCSYIEAHLVLEELGATLTPSPFVGTLLATQVLAAAGIPAAGELLERIAAGTTAAVVVPGSDLVIDAVGAEILLVLRGDQVHAVDPSAVTVSATPAMDPTWRFATVTVDAPGDPIGTVDPAYVTTVGATMMTALQAGAAREALERTVAYLKERHQFGRPLGSFQALKQRCADLLVQVETARTMSWAAAWELTQPAPDRRLVHAAKTWCSDAFSQVAAEMIQLHGGVAITWEHDAHLYFKRAHATAQLFRGDT
ncbi:acyl-CoA dehydrogenase family protein [Nocardioides luteus]|uniref:acyl-CoA dehydrogenase family protein n=1 Tax=Nocardioides luteus TaxID=1844 RepID=UPI0018C935BB|nr:acyl-CoA dehydrogenase family protein [Nocardioides luteus]MBG6099546.1 alkylation response protein AidB-like acyl-CoA dehydrogenase [Nocardioides luteus]